MSDAPVDERTGPGDPTASRPDDPDDPPAGAGRPDLDAIERDFDDIERDLQRLADGTYVGEPSIDVAGPGSTDAAAEGTETAPDGN